MFFGDDWWDIEESFGLSVKLLAVDSQSEVAIGVLLSSDLKETAKFDYCSFCESNLLFWLSKLFMCVAPSALFFLYSSSITVMLC